MPTITDGVTEVDALLRHLCDSLAMARERGDLAGECKCMTEIDKWLLVRHDLVEHPPPPS